MVILRNLINLINYEYRNLSNQSNLNRRFDRFIDRRTNKGVCACPTLRQ